jgi:adenosyl cobinamide kinase/adenosyl cobinamide phosphate guanylyltransferase
VTLTVVLGGIRSGKSAVAEQLAADAAADRGEPVTYIATGRAADADMAARIEIHRARRPASWSTLEVTDGPDLPGLLLELSGVALVDSLGTWVASHHDFELDAAALTDSLARRRSSTIVVAEEVGLSIHPPTPLGRLFVDVLGSLNQAVAAVADRAMLVVAGRIVEL